MKEHYHFLSAAAERVLTVMCYSHEQNWLKKPMQCADRMQNCEFCCISTSTHRQVIQHLVDQQLVHFYLFCFLYSVQ